MDHVHPLFQPCRVLNIQPGTNKILEATSLVLLKVQATGADINTMAGTTGTRTELTRQNNKYLINHLLI